MSIIKDNNICCVNDCNGIAEYNYKFLFIPTYCEKHKKEKMHSLLKICIICQEKYKIYEHCKNCSEYELLINKRNNIKKYINK